MCDNYNLRLALRVILTSSVDQLIECDPLTLDAKQIGAALRSAHQLTTDCRQTRPAANG
jgi:hypothetical protein